MLILSSGKDSLVEAIIENKYECDFAMLTLGMLHKNASQLLDKKYIDMIVQISSPFFNTATKFCIVHFTKNKPNKFLTGIFNGIAYEKRNRKSCYEKKEIWQVCDEYTEDFQDFLENINYFFEYKNIKRTDLNINSYDEFNLENLNPLYYTKQAIKIRNEIEKNDYMLLSEFADIIASPTDKNIKARCINSKSFQYPFEYNNLEAIEVERAIKIKKGDIIALLIGEEPKFYLYNEEYNDICIKAGNYCIIRCKKSKNISYLVNYLNDEKARLFFASSLHGSYIHNLSKEALMNLKVIIPNEQMLKIAEKTQSYVMNQKSISPFEINKLIRDSYKIKYTKESQKMISDDIINLVSNMKISALKELINEDLNEVDICFDNGAYKSAIILCGSILEAVLLDWLSEYEDTEDVFNVAIGEDGRDLELSKIIFKLKNIIKPRWYESNKAHEIRKTRNMVHPKECIKNNKKVTEAECEKIINNLKDILESKENRHK